MFLIASLGGHLHSQLQTIFRPTNFNKFDIWALHSTCIYYSQTNPKNRKHFLPKMTLSLIGSALVRLRDTNCVADNFRYLAGPLVEIHPSAGKVLAITMNPFSLSSGLILFICPCASLS
jgi:hypothetical protein